MPYLSYLSVFCPAAPTENASIHGRANTPRERPARVGPELFKAYLLASSLRQTAIALLPSPLLSSPLPLSSSPAFVTARDIYPTRDIHTHTRVHAHTWRINIYVYGERRKEKNGRDISERRSVDRRNRSLRTELVPNRKEGGGGGGRWASIGGHVDGEEIVTAR